MSWREDKPRESDLLQDFALTVRQRKADFRSAITKHFYWQENSGASAGIPRASSSTPGSARAFYATTQSEVSAYRDGTLLVQSTTSRLYALTSASSVLVGSKHALVVDTIAASQIAAGSRYLSQVSFGRALGGGSFTTNWGTPFSATPRVLLSLEPNGAGAFYTYSLSTATTGGMTFRLGWLGNGADPSSATLHWLASGLSTL